jgi:hypothetical protein
MERLNLNVPDETGRKLRRLAARAGWREAELARELLVRAVDQEEKREIRERFRSSINPKLRKRLLEINRRGGAAWRCAVMCSLPNVGSVSELIEVSSTSSSCRRTRSTR